ncbi:MAG: pentapeptide repeat-containing protein [Aulosira sp. ZfuVER01]|nr:pentapeptide repeat-containing protein [Aulosira sp. ZfuVER01]MDZ7996683.1 pentapeptide repeat-containing protein [Aulosira sp. DedVER01a]MDZ8053733.1 pentapeptide repeat-containing protein [Aulosira sp. ZfuCHP01]
MIQLVFFVKLVNPVSAHVYDNENVKFRILLPMNKSLKKANLKNSLLQVFTRRSTVKGFCQIFIALVFTSTIFIVIPYWEPQTKNEKGELVCQGQKVATEDFICRIGNSKLLQQIQNFSVIFVAFLFILDTFERKKRAYREAWSLIDGARDSETSGARILALKELQEDKVSLRGLDAEKADLMEINLQGAFLEKANLRGALLQRINLISANVQDSDFREANLQEAKLQKANLRRVKLQRAKLNKAELQGAILSGANMQKATLEETQLQEADLSGVDFREADLWRANLSGANIESAIFTGAKKLDIAQVQKAKNWEKAIYGKDFAPELEKSLLRRDYPSELNIEQLNQKTGENDLLQSFIKLFMLSESSNIQAILELRRKLDTAIELLTINQPLSAQDSVQLESIVTEVVSEWLKAKNATPRDVEDELRDKLQNFQDIGENARKKLEKEQEFDLSASEWLKIRYVNLKDLGIRGFLNKHPEMTKPGALLYSPDQINQLSDDIGNCLNLLVESLAAHNLPSIAKGTMLKMPKSIYLGVLREIWEEVMPKFIEIKMENESEPLSDGAFERLKGYFFILRNQINQLQDE